MFPGLYVKYSVCREIYFCEKRGFGQIPCLVGYTKHFQTEGLLDLASLVIFKVTLYLSLI